MFFSWCKNRTFSLNRRLSSWRALQFESRKISVDTGSGYLSKYLMLLLIYGFISFKKIERRAFGSSFLIDFH
ncbi:hypothetical protein EG343_06120 [Chryseobacterium nakagawai]|uniref:Uncharacterized protein n=1 Tax=Chryseobacterium nakagawai TaxID=1241982 RepID=A0AAD0YFY5_CHRNA|nr:hypothetical protein EG343_06120 [Chryseobacterium nakagawai]